MHRPRPVARTVAVALAAMAVFLLRIQAKAGPAEDYQTLFGEEDRQVTATLSCADDVAFAAKLLKAAESLKDSPGLRTLILVKACDFGACAPTGHATALKALEQLASTAPKRAAEWRDKRLGICRAAYAAARGADRDRAAGELLELLMLCAHQAGEQGQWAQAKDYYKQAASVAVTMHSPLAGEIRGAVAEIVERQEAERRLEEMKARLAQQPENVSLRRMVVLRYLLDRDDPGEAAKHLTVESGEAMRTYVPLAAKDAGALPEAACLELADWYASLAEGVGVPAKATALSRAHRYYKLYLSLHGKQDAARLKAALAMKGTEAALQKIGRAPGSLGGTARKITFESPDLQQAFDKGVKYLRSRQADNGSFPAFRLADTAYPVATTAAVVVVLLDSGATAEDPAVAKALDWLGKQKTNSTLGLSWRAHAYLAAARTARKFVLPLARDARKLLASTADGTFRETSTGTPVPLTSYDRRHRRYDLISTALGLRGLSAGAQTGLEVPEGLWSAAMAAVLKAQHKDGGWGTSGYGSTRGSHTAGGVLAVVLCLQRGAGKVLAASDASGRFPALQAGLRRLGALHAAILNEANPESVYRAYNSQTYPNFYQYLWLVSEGARAAGRESIGGAEWFKSGADLLLKLRGEDGSWTGYADGDAPTVFALLFLINGAQTSAP